MSGKKRITVTVDQSAWQDAQQKAARLRDVQRELPSMLEAVRRAQQEQAARDAAEMRTRQEGLERSLRGLSDQARRLEASTNRRLQATTEMLLNEVRESAGQIRAETRQLLDEQAGRFAGELDREREERRREFAGLRGELDEIHADRDRVAAAAATAAADARPIHDAIARDLPHERFAAGRLATLGKHLAVAEDNVAQGHGEAALAQAQGLYVELGELRVEIELKNAEWMAARLAALSAVTALRETISINTRLDVTDDGVTAELDVDFWSDGELGAIKAEAGRLSARVSAGDDPPTLDELRVIAERDVPALDERLSAAVATARTRQWASQIRVNLAERVVDVLEHTTGYVWDGEATYAGEDQRGAFYSKLRDLDESEIVVEVAPDEDGKSCVLRVLSYESGTPDETERRERAKAIVGGLREQGLSTGEAAAEHELPDPALRDLEQVRKIQRAVPEPG